MAIKQYVIYVCMTQMANEELNLILKLKKLHIQVLKYIDIYVYILEYACFLLTPMCNQPLIHVKPMYFK